MQLRLKYTKKAMDLLTIVVPTHLDDYSPLQLQSYQFLPGLHHFCLPASWLDCGRVKPFILCYGLPALQQGSSSNPLKMNQIDFKAVDVRVLRWLLSGQTVMAAAHSCSGMLESTSSVRAGLSPAAGDSSYLPSFIPCSLPSSESRQLSS